MPRPSAGPPKPEKPPCVEGRSHEWQVPPDPSRPARCTVCGRTYTFGPREPGIWSASRRSKGDL